ncbi:hypothetical protein P7K49_035761 [Saguinus oedipus]|uniref:ethanolamine kinase n=1 Tax=Saguinus oedipus TaxID=9490 RepID=A0ABQ9TNM2_SAGOE|nr:hypothetical protein P7K49_035761 [Saguinus oedipus]
MEEKAAASAGGREPPGPQRAAAVAYFGISVDPDDILPGALRLIQELRPHWKPEQVRTKVVEWARGRGWGPAGAATRMRGPSPPILPGKTRLTPPSALHTPPSSWGSWARRVATCPLSACCICGPHPLALGAGAPRCPEARTQPALKPEEAGTFKRPPPPAPNTRIHFCPTPWWEQILQALSCLYGSLEPPCGIPASIPPLTIAAGSGSAPPTRAIFPRASWPQVPGHICGQSYPLNPLSQQLHAVGILRWGGRFTDGITNKLVACYVEEDMQDCVLVRVYGERTELLVDRENEVRNFQLLRAHGCAPKLYCTFQNGLCYEYMQGVALGPEHIREPQLFRTRMASSVLHPPSNATTHMEGTDLNEA